MLPHPLKKVLTAELGVPILGEKPVGGGDMHKAYLISSSRGDFFLKFNDILLSSEMFATESKGLELLRSTQTLSIPKVWATGEAGPFSFLLLEYISPGQSSKEIWEDFGRSLARLHRRSRSDFGLDHDNFIGRLHQPNGDHNSFSDFYFEERLWPQYQLAAAGFLLSPEEGKQLEAIGKGLAEKLPPEPPALIHGDLWNGNFLIGSNGLPYLIDPAVAYVHREIDLAMARLFGGFDPAFYSAYQEAYPLQDGWENRIPFFQLYYLLVHLNLFGKSYYPAVKRAMDASHATLGFS